MGIPRRRIGLVSIPIVLLIGGLAAAIVFWQGFDPGDKDDRSTALLTPTFTTGSVLYFDVAPEESQVDFLADVRGVPLEGVFPVESGTIILEPVGDELRVLVRLNINVDQVEMGSVLAERVMRGAMSTGDYPIAFYVAASQDLVPVTEEEITFTLDGELDVHGVTHAHRMSVTAQLVSGHMWAVATSDLDLGDHGVEFETLIGSSVIGLTAQLDAYEVAAPGS